MTAAGCQKAVAIGLLDRGMCEVIERDKIQHVHGQPLLNGWFGRGKGKYLAGHDGDPSFEVLRLIMNLKPSNSLFLQILGDIATLPYMGQWTTLQLETWQCLAWSAEDFVTMLYITRVPEA